ncbi:MAG: diacylglycerol/lipid kinase family protein [Candidatus Helarchaeota archaeon]
MLLIINPKAANKKAEKRFYNEIQPLLDFKHIDYQYTFTEYPNHATELARHAIKEGGETFIVAVGGDGTFNEVANGFYENGALLNPECGFGVLPCGTGSDFIKTVDIPKLYADAIAILETGQIQRQDVGIARFSDLEGVPNSRMFINVADIGLGGDVVDRVNRTTKIFGGKMSFLIGSIRGILHHKKTKTRIVLDDDETTAYEFNGNMTCICIGKYFGGGMMISPNSNPVDGYFNVITIQDASRWRLLTNIGKIYDGSHLKMPEAKEHALCKKLKAFSENPVFLDLDGEQVAKSEIYEFEIIPNSLPVKVGHLFS